MGRALERCSRAPMIPGAASSSELHVSCAEDRLAEEVPSRQPAEPPLRRYRQVLPPSLFLLVLIIVLVIFSGILLPFVLALFFAYLVYPLVRGLNKLHVKRLRVPRWVAILIVYFAVGFGVYKFVPLALAGVTREFASLFHEIPNLFKGLKTQREKLYAAIETKLRYDALPTEVRHEIEVEFLRTWAARHPKAKDEGTAAPADHVAAAAHPDALPPYEEESPEYLAFKREFFDYLKKVVDAPDTYDLLVAGSPKEVLPLEQLKRLEQRTTAIVREIRDHLSE